MTTQTRSPVGFVDLGITTPGQLLSIVARSVGQERVDRADLTIADVPYDLPALTTRVDIESRAPRAWPV